ncbi:MAG: type II secretion system protein, partial [Desulfamplus sp.]|nr:type II secretion system protein [Desulfamplus sp.]
MENEHSDDLTLSDGFTLLELIVVLAVMGTVLFMTLPKFRTLTFGDDSNKQLNILINTIRDLKKRSVADGMDYILHLDAEKSVLWITSSDMLSDELIDNDQKKDAQKKETPLPESFYLTDVEIYGKPNYQIEENQYKIRFSRHGYCDMSRIHIKDRSSGDAITIVIEPFIGEVSIEHKYIAFEQCR